MEEKQSNWIKNLVLRLFEPGDSEEGDQPPTQEARDASDRINKRKTSAGALGRSGDSGAATGSDKLLALKSALEFESDVHSRLEGIESSQDLLLYVYEVLLFKLASLREIGLMNKKSGEVVDLLHEKLESLLVRPDEIPSEKRRMELESLRKENELLKTRLNEIQSKYVKSGIISEREIEIEKECVYLKRRITEINTSLQIAKKRNTALSAVHEANRSLRAKNSLLNGKVVHQRRLLQSLTSNQPQQSELLSTIEKLDEENKRLKDKFRGQAGMVEQLQVQFPDDGQFREVVNTLMEENARLRNEMEEGEQDMQELSAGHSEETLLESFERLQEENERIKGMLESKQSLIEAIESKKSGAGSSDGIAEMIKKENERLKQIVNEKKEAIEVLSNNPSSQILMKTVLRLKNEKESMVRDLQHKEQLRLQSEHEKKALLSQTRNQGAMNKKIRQVMGELEFQKKLVASLKKVEFEYQALRKEHSQMRTQFEAAVFANKEMSKKLARLTAEYEILIKEYENLFDKI